MSGSYTEEGMDKKNRTAVPSRNAIVEPRRENGRSRYHKKQENKVSNDYHVSKVNYVNKISDKKPQRRENYNIRHEKEVDPGDILCTNTVYQGGSKKKNLNHLLNFSFIPREGAAQDSYRNQNSTYKRSNNKWTHGCVKFNKEQFLQANCQFIVKESADYSLHTADPDKLVDWDCIEYVRIFMHEIPCCPICLYPPTAAKLTRCGHIYCWPCILHYLSLREEKTWMKCPICYEAVHEIDLKSVQTILTHAYGINEEINMNLMKKERGSTNAMKISEWIDSKDQLFNIEDKMDVFYCKLLLASPEKLLNNLLEDQLALEKELSQCGTDTLEASFIDCAIQQIQEKYSISSKINSIQIENIKTEKNEDNQMEISTKPINKSELLIHYSNAFDDVSNSPVSQVLNADTGVENIDTVLPHIEVKYGDTSSVNSENISSPLSIEEFTPKDCSLSSPEENNTMNINFCSISSPEENHKSLIDCSSTSSPEETNRSFHTNVYNSSKAAPYFYFYQADDGQHIYLNPLNAKCLLKEYGSWENCPQKLKAKIIQMDYFTMNEEIRHRWRYLAHLPISCEFTVVELDLKPPIISQETRDIFADQLANRQRMRQKKLHEEKRFNNFIKERERKQFGLIPFGEVKNSNMAEIDEGSSFRDSAEEVYEDPVKELLYNNSNSPPSSEGQLLQDSGDQASKSFAQMLRDGKRIKSDVKARCIGANLNETPSVQACASNKIEDEDYNPPPQYQNSFGEAIQEAFNNLNIKKGNGKKKKNKREKTVLFSNQMARNSNM